MTERKQEYFDESHKVFRTAVGADTRLPAGAQEPAPKLICEAVSHRYAKRIASALNLYVPKNERRAMQREVRTDQIRDAFKGSHDR